MPSFLSRLRSLASKRSISHSSSGAPEHADQTVDSAQHATLSPDASYSPRTPDFALDSKIAPDISALLASVEEDTADIRNDATEDIYDDTADVYYEGREGFVQGLKPRPPVAGASKYAIAEVQDKGIEDRGKGKDAISDTISSAGGVPPSTHNSQKRWSTFGREGKRVIPSMRSFVRAQSSRKEASEITMSLASQSQSHLGRSSDNKTLSSGTTASRPSTVVTGTQRTTSTFGRPPIPSRPPTGVSSTRTPSRQSSGRFSVRDNVHNPDGNALLSWSPPAEIIADEQSILDSSSSSSHSDSAQAHSPEVHEAEEQNVVSSPSPRTFGHPTPHHQQSHIMATTVPFPPFHSTPLSTPTRPADQGNQQTSLFRFADSSLSPISTTLGRAFRSNSERPNTAKTARSTGNLRDQRPSRSRSTLRSQTRRRSAVWSAEAASVGVVVGSTQDFGWPADVSREMLRLSLGEEAAYTAQEAVQRQEAGKTVQDTRNRALSAPIYLPNNLPVAEDWHASNSSHELLTSTSRQDKHGLMRAGAQGSSSHPFSSNSFPFPSSSSSPTSPTLLYPSGLAEPIDLGNLAREHLIQNPKDSVRSQPRELDDKPANANDVDSEGVQHSGGGEDQMIQHVRSDSADQIRWDSRRLQEYLASSGGSEKAVDLAALRPSTPIMKADSASTYQTAASSSLLQPPSLSVQAPTPQGSPGHSRQESSPETEGENLQVPVATSTPEASEKSKGKRKAEESEGESPPGLKIGRKTTFATPLGGRGAYHKLTSKFCVKHVVTKTLVLQALLACQTRRMHLPHSCHGSRVENAYACPHRCPPQTTRAQDHLQTLLYSTPYQVVVVRDRSSPARYLIRGPPAQVCPLLPPHPRHVRLLVLRARNPCLLHRHLQGAAYRIADHSHKHPYRSQQLFLRVRQR